MPLFEVTKDGLAAHASRAFADIGLYERADIQRLLRQDISVLGEDLLVIAEEFGQWEDASRRLDLLALDKQGRLVVIEIKRTHDGGHMELQALRYAAMISPMTYDDVLRTYTATRGGDANARAELEAFLELGDIADDPVISSNVRILLVSADFGRELTTAVLWLNNFDGMDIRCVRLIPYSIDGKILLDIQQVLPLPEVADYQVKIRRKEAARERASNNSRDFTRYQIVVDGQASASLPKRKAIREMVVAIAARGIDPAEIRSHLPNNKLCGIDGEHPDIDAARDALVAVKPDVDLGRWFIDSPLVYHGRTYILSKMWGMDTEPTLNKLATAFPTSGVAFTRAEDAD